jgi:hypothetical protein
MSGQQEIQPATFVQKPLPALMLRLRQTAVFETQTLRADFRAAQADPHNVYRNQLGPIGTLFKHPDCAERKTSEPCLGVQRRSESVNQLGPPRMAFRRFPNRSPQLHHFTL